MTGDVFTGLEGTLASTMVKIEPVDSRLNWSFLYFFLLTQFDNLNRRTIGSTIFHANKPVFQSFLLPFSPLPERSAIADILHTVDLKIAAEKRRKAALDALFKSLLHHLMMGKVRLSRSFVQQLKEKKEVLSWRSG
ncbi:MAG: restriction endonuclease subunit S [Candidatus Aminicenantales bacterium]